MFKLQNPKNEAEERYMSFERDQQAFRQEPDYEELAYKDVQRQDLLKWQQDLADELEILKHDLRSETWDDDKKIWIQQQQLIGYNKDGKEVYIPINPLMNEIGIKKVEMMCKTLLSRNLINSCLSDDTILNLLKRTSNTLATDLACNYVYYETSFTNLSAIMSLVKNIITSSPYRALNGWNKRIDSTISKRIEAFNEGTRVQNPKKFLGIFG